MSSGFPISPNGTLARISAPRRAIIIPDDIGVDVARRRPMTMASKFLVAAAVVPMSRLL
jgi:hypothetical protein